MTPSVGEIRAVGFSFAPAGWHLCDGSLLPIADNNVLFALIGTSYGGDGTTTFGLPDLRGKYPLNQGQGTGLTNRVLASSGGTETVTLTTAQMGAHGHTVMASTAAANVQPPTGNYFAAPVDTTTTTNTMLNYLPDTFAAKTVIPLDPTTVSNSGGISGATQAHENRMPYTAVTYIIALQGIYPSPQ